MSNVTCVEFTASASEQHNPSLKWARAAEHLEPKELLRAINMDDMSDSAGSLGNMPELTRLLDNYDVVKKFSVSLVTVNLM